MHFWTTAALQWHIQQMHLTVVFGVWSILTIDVATLFEEKGSFSWALKLCIATPQNQ
jgi:hypothetical protein